MAAFLGPPGSFSHSAALQIFPPSFTTIPLHPLPTFRDIIEGVQSSKYAYGVLPFENSSNGSVDEVLDLLGDHEGVFGDVSVCREVYLGVRHQLLIKSRGEETGNGKGDLGEALKKIEKIYTHPKVWGQCSSLLAREECRKIARQDCASTSEAARLVATGEEEPGTIAALASELAGKEFGLETLMENVEDRANNTTRFFVVRNKGTHRLPPLPEDKVKGENLYKNLVLFMIEHEKPGSLAEALSVFKKHDFNLTSINTRPSRKRQWQYIFIVECWQGRKESTPKAAVDLLEDLSLVASNCRHVGVWTNQLPQDTKEESKT